MRAGPPQAERRARRSLDEATTPAAAGRAIADCRRAADVVRRTADPAATVALLDDALAMADRFEIDADRTLLLVERAEALLAAGRLDAARRAGYVAAAAADADDDAVLLGRAALVMSGLWANELRAPDARGRATGLQRRALARLPAGHEGLAARLTARLAATQAFYGDQSTDGVQEAADLARRSGDPRAVAEALSLVNHVLLGPGHEHARIAVADEMIAVAATCPDPVLAVVGLCWRTVDLFLAADPRAERSLSTLRERDQATGCIAVTYQRRVLETMLAIRAGRLTEAEVSADECLALGTTVGDADALAYYGAHLLLIRWFQGRDEELFGLFRELASAPTLDEVDYTFEAAYAALAARTGRLDLATSLLERIRRLDLAGLPRLSTWTAMLMGVIVAAEATGDVAMAGHAYELLAPYGHLPIMPSFAVADFGAADHFLGLAARCVGRLDDAVAHFERGIHTNSYTRNAPLVCLGRVELAETLLCADRPGARTDALALYDRAVAEGIELGIDALARRWSTRRDELARHAPDVELTMRRSDRGWVITHGQAQLCLPDLVGLHHLARLVAAPGREIAAVVLAGGPTEGLAPHVEQQVIDDEARDAYRRRARQLANEIAQARQDGADARVACLEEELDALVGQLRSAMHAGHIRRFAGPDERARTAVRKAILRAIASVTALDAGLGEHLRATVVTGLRCVYRPVGPPN